MATGGASGLSRAIKGVGAIAALVPGVATLAKVVPLPLTVGNLIGGLSLLGGIAIVIVVIVLRRRISGLKPGLAAALILGSCVIGSAFFVLYYGFGAAHVITYEDADTDGKGKEVRLIAPLHPSPALEQILDRYNGDYAEALHSATHQRQVAGLIARENGSAVALLAVYMILAQSFLLACVVGGAWRIAAFFEDKAAAADS